MSTDPQSLIIEALSAIQGLAALVDEFEDSRVGVTGWQLSQILVPIGWRLSAAIEALDK